MPNIAGITRITKPLKYFCFQTHSYTAFPDEYPSLLEKEIPKPINKNAADKQRKITANNR